MKKGTFSEAEDRLAQQAACQAPPCGVIEDPHPLHRGGHCSN